jgi:FMN-dependent NADH-azoreductase
LKNKATPLIEVETTVSLFRLDASIRVEGSASREIADIVEQHWLDTHPGATIVRRHLGTEPLPADAWGAAVSTKWTPEADRTQFQRDALSLASRLEAELVEADAVLLAVPLYNWGISQHIKTWIDLVVSGPQGAGAQLLLGKPTVLVTVRGGAYGPGTPKHGWDHSTGYLRRILADVWGADLTVVERELTLAGVNPALDPFKELAAQRHEAARSAAAEAGRVLAKAA